MTKHFFWWNVQDGRTKRTLLRHRDGRLILAIQTVLLCTKIVLLWRTFIKSRRHGVSRTLKVFMSLAPSKIVTYVVNKIQYFTLNVSTDIYCEYIYYTVLYFELFYKYTLLIHALYIDLIWMFLQTYIVDFL